MNRLTAFTVGVATGAAALLLALGWLGLDDDEDRPLR